MLLVCVCVREQGAAPSTAVDFTAFHRRERRGKNNGSFVKAGDEIRQVVSGERNAREMVLPGGKGKGKRKRKALQTSQLRKIRDESS